MIGRQVLGRERDWPCGGGMGMHGSLTGSIDIAEGFYLPNTKQGTVDSCQHRSPYHDHSRPDLLEGVDCGSTDHDVFKGAQQLLARYHSFWSIRRCLPLHTDSIPTAYLFLICHSRSGAVICPYWMMRLHSSIRALRSNKLSGRRYERDASFPFFNTWPMRRPFERPYLAL